MAMKYKIIVALTFLLPTSLYLLVNALFLSITPDAIIYAELEDISIIEHEEEYFIYGALEYKGYVVKVDDDYGILADSKTVIKVGWKYYQVREMKLIESKLIEQEQGVKIPAVVIFTLLGGLIGLLIIVGKIDLKRKNWRLAALIGIWSFVGIMFVVDLIVSNMLGGLMVMAISFTLYYIEHLIKHGMMTDDALRKLRQSIGG